MSPTHSGTFFVSLPPYGRKMEGVPVGGGWTFTIHNAQLKSVPRGTFLV
jgi:hypothetical protein